MITYNLSISKNPQFQTVTGLTNLVFDKDNIVSGQMATEAQIQELWQDIIHLEERIDYCCRDIVYWDFQVRIRDRYGNIITDYLENRRTGIARRGKNFTMQFPLKAIPKYENNVATTSAYTGQTAKWTDGNATKCPLNGTDITLFNGLCALLYRGTEGEYFNMSTRPTVAGLAPGVSYGISNQDNLATSVIPIKIDGTEGSSFPIPSQPAISGWNIVNKHFAEADSEGNIIIHSYWPIHTGTEVQGGGRSGKSYGRVYRMDLRDVSIGA